VLASARAHGCARVPVPVGPFTSMLLRRRGAVHKPPPSVRATAGRGVYMYTYIICLYIAYVYLRACAVPSLYRKGSRQHVETWPCAGHVSHLDSGGAVTSTWWRGSHQHVSGEAVTGPELRLDGRNGTHAPPPGETKQARKYACTIYIYIYILRNKPAK
jgi:hypothetical protein